MKASTRLVFLLILVFVTINTLSQNGLEGKKSIYLQLGASGGFSPNLSQPVLIPQIGLDAAIGILGFRVNGQFFKTSPEFDVNGYLDPIKSVLTISNLQEKNSNVLLGFSSYLNLGKKDLRIQPGVGLKYLMQRGATATAVYNQTPETTILKFPDGDANRNLLMIEPNIRASYGKPGQMLRFFIEAGYTIPAGKNEITYSSRTLTSVVDPRGNIDLKALLNSKQNTTTEKLLPAFASVGAGIQIKLFSGNEAKITHSNMPNNYGINDDGIKRSNEPVPGALITAEIWNEIQQNYTTALSSKTDHIGTYHFKNLKPGRYRFTTKLPGKFWDWAKKSSKEKLKESSVYFRLEENLMLPGTIIPHAFGSKTAKSPLRYVSPDFYLKEESNDITVSIFTSVNNYGINDDGIKKSISQNEINPNDSSSNLFLVGCRRYISYHTWGDGPCSSPPGNGGTITYSYICANGSYIRSSPMFCWHMNSTNKIINNKNDSDFTVLHYEGKSQSKCNSDNPILLSIFDIYESYMKTSIIGKNLTDAQLDNIQVKINDDIKTFVGDSLNIIKETQIIDNQIYHMFDDFRFRLRNHAKYNVTIDDCEPWHKGWCFILDFGGNNTEKTIPTQSKLDFIELNENKNTMILCYDLSNFSEKPRNGTYNCTVPEIEVKDNSYMQVIKYEAEGKISSTKNTIGKVKVKNNKAYVSMRYINKN
ncbi:MAG: carboxypeptidase-like regulatory domain-containing protein [Bacteroidetes bacterium]|nr:carboxypeptidase-like regulatory domain-containing protein [Bacteroidota bacterium]